MARSKSSKGWLREHFSDEFVKRSKQDGYRSRAAYKLLELQEKDRMVRSGMRVIDLGAAPGGWSQILAQWVQPAGQVIALDILPMDALPDVHFIQGDFTEQSTLDELLLHIGNQKVHWVFSDMAPNLSGVKTTDQSRAMLLAELALEMAQLSLLPGGGLVVKLFQGNGFDAFLQQVRQQFSTVKIRKPQASRARSQEVYMVAMGYMTPLV